MSPHQPPHAPVQASLTRRQALKLGAISTFSGLLVPFKPSGTARAGDGEHAVPGRRHARGQRSSTERPKNIIFMVSDGMSLGTPSMAGMFSQTVRQRPSTWWRLARQRDTVHGYFDMRSLNNPVTDSSAASCAWATGSRINNGMMNMLPDGTPLKPIGTLVHESGRRVGLVTTTHVPHATPAGFVAVSRSRGDFIGIASQYLGIVDVLMGGGVQFFEPGNRHDGRDLKAEYQEAGYRLLTHRDEVIEGEPARRMLGLFADGHLPYTVDQRHDEPLKERVPTLAEMTDLALRSLGEGEEGFLLQVEGGRVDHAAHNTDAAALLWDQLAFEDAVDIAVDFARERGDTLVVVTTDHGNANPGLHGAGIRGISNSEAFDRIARFKVSFNELWSKLREAGRTGAALGNHIAELTGIDLPEDEVNIIAEALDGQRPPELNRRLRNTVGMLGQIFGNHTGVQFIGTQHTQDLAPTLSIGPGAHRFHGLMDNTEAFVHLTALMEIDYENPKAEQAEAMLPADEHDWVTHAPTIPA